MTTVVERAQVGSQEETLASVVKRLGHAVSTTLLHAPCCIFRLDQVDGVIGYQQIRRCAVVIGDPICLPENRAELTRAFHLHCQKMGWNVVYLLASDSFAHWAIHNGCQTLIQVGEELIVNPVKFEKKQKLRWKINQSINSGVVVKEYNNFDPVFENKMKSAIKVWLQGKQGPQIHMVNLRFFESGEKRIFYALQNGNIIGLLTLLPIDRFKGWVATSHFAIADAPIGTTEHLMSAALDALAKENCQFLCLGVSASSLGETVGLTRLSKFIVKHIFQVASRLFRLEDKKAYLKKFRPHSLPTYILSSGRLTLSALMAVKEALNVKL